MMTPVLIRSETTKLITSRGILVLGIVAVLGTWPLAWVNASSSVGVRPNDPRLFSAEPVPVQFQGFEMTGLGYVLVVALAAVWAGSEYGTGQQIRTTLLATPSRLAVFGAKASLAAAGAAAVGVVTMVGTLGITHSAGGSGVDPWTLTPAIWTNIGGVTLAWSLTALISFSVGSLARSAIAPLLLITPLVIGLSDVLTALWDKAKYLPVAAGAALYSDPAPGNYLSPAVGGLVQAAWALAFLGTAAVVFVRRDL
jgi:ABC-2 type transport system permease protein